MKIVIADDNKESLYLLETMLKGSGYEVVATTNGAEALEKLRAEDFDMVIADILMPVMDGFELCRECKGDEKLKDIPFVFYTATYTDEKDEELTLRLGADKFIRKPTEPEEFIKIIQSIIKDMEEGKVGQRKPVVEEEKEVFKLYSERLVNKLEKKMLNLEAEINERKQAEEMLQESERKYRSLFESMLNGSAYCKILVDENNQPIDFVHLEVNDAWERSIGLKKEDVIGKKITEVIPGIRESETNLISIYGKVALTGEETEFELYFEPLGKWFTISVYSPQRGYFVAVFEDTTERKRAEEKLHESEEKYRSLINNVKLGVFRSTPEPCGGFLEVNPAMEEITGYSREELLQMNACNLYMCPEERETVLEEIASAKEKTTKELRLRKKDGTEMVVSDTKVAVRDNAGKILYFDGIMEDITERKQMEETLRESRDYLERLTNSMWDAVFEVKMPERVIEWANDSFKLIGYDPGECIGKTTEFLYPDESEFLDFGNKLKNVIAAGKDILHAEQLLKRKSGEVFPAEITATISKEKGEIVRVTSIVRDITERKQAEEREKQLQQELSLASRLASIGELAAGVAHEINNPLTGILGFSQRLLRKSADEEVSRDLEMIHNEALRAAKVVENLLTFARRREPTKECSDINDIVQKALELRAYELKTSNIEVVTDLAPSLPKTIADFQQIEEVFLNIILNAEQVMTEAKGGGKLIIKTQEINGYIRVSLTDDGPGIPAENLDRLFNPFFTTRGEKGGTGLGLSVCHGIVTGHGGRIYAKSKLGKGATFIVELPVITEEVDKSKIVEA